jgi:hypothetical protein
MSTQATLQSILESLLSFDPNSEILESAILCEFSSEDSTPTLHLTLWRGRDLYELPLPSSLEMASEGFSDIGRVYSLQLA